MRKNLLITPIAMTLVAGAMTLSAQDPTSGTVAGRVTGANGQPLSGVSVTLNSPALLTPRQFTTDASGQFRAQMLVSGNYTITYVLNGYLTRRLTTYVAAGQVIRGDMQLRPIEVQAETVEIMATSAQHVDKTDTIVAATMSQQKLIELSGAVTPENLVSIVPGTLRDGTEYMFRGSTKKGSKFLIDGSNVTNMAEATGWGVDFPMTDAIESISFILSPLNARYGDTDGGLVSFVLNKGTNEFKGSVRFIPDARNTDNGIGSTNRYLWTQTSAYPNNRGVSSTINPGTDQMSKSYQFYLSGPIWKDHISFSWNSQNFPTRRYTKYQYEQTGSLWVSGNGSAIPQSRWNVGTYYKDAKTDEVIRKAELLEATDPMNLISSIDASTNDTYTLFYQITQNHQIEYSYSEIMGNGYNNRSDYPMADSNANPIYTTRGNGNQRRWNLAYKGIIGSSGLLEARYSSFTQAWTNVQADLRPKRNVRVLTMPSYYPINGTNNGDPNNYYASGLIDSMLNRRDGIKDSSVNTSNPRGTYDFNAGNEGPGDTAYNQPINVNYQHILETKNFGRHIFDVGFQRERSSWVNPNMDSGGTLGINAQTVVRSPGRINIGLTTSDIFGYAGTPVSQYAGKFIVYNMNYATFNSVDPYGFSRFNTGGLTGEPIDPNQRLIDYQSGYGKGVIWPTMGRQIGGAFTDLCIQQTSYYLNDLWIINDHHSVMGGVRYDMFRAWDSSADHDIHSYGLPTFRFEYKFDISGDQKRVVNVSWGQFHTMPAISAWGGFLDRRIKEMVWNVGPPDGKPYLVDFDDIMNENNYRTIADNFSGGVNEVDKNYKSLVGTEFTTGIRFNLDNGGTLRVTYVNRDTANDGAYFYNGWKPSPTGDGTMVYSRLLKNIDVERSYNSLELEWEVPVTKRVLFGGSYMFARKMENGTDESNSPQKSANKTVYYWDEYNQYDYPNWGWNPVRMRNSEHQYNAYLNYDLSAGKVKSNAAFRVWYTSSGFGTRSYPYEMGYPVIPGITLNNGGAVPDGNPPMSSMPTGTALSNTRTVYYNIHRTSGNDGWGLRLAYNLDVPITHKLRWFANVTCENPFNHRHKGTGVYAIEAWVNSGNVVPQTITYADGRVVQANNPYAIGGMKSDNVQRGNANLFAPNQVAGGRSIGLQTGLRF